MTTTITGPRTGADLDPPSDAAMVALARATLAEDLGGGSDVTTQATVPAGALACADVVSRAPGVVCGLPLAAAVLAQRLPQPMDLHYHAADGEAVAAGQVLLTVTGSTRDILTCERSALNLLGRLSGIATLTAAWVAAVAGTAAVIRDTRKTTPGLRAMEKYAVRCGGGRNHRRGLHDAALIKDNHIAAAGGVVAAMRAVAAAAPEVSCEVECDTLEQVEQAAGAGASLILLDNMDCDTMRRAVAVATAAGAATEASGGLALDHAAQVAATGVDYLAVGALTHSAPTLDIGLDLRV